MSAAGESPIIQAPRSEAPTRADARAKIPSSGFLRDHPGVDQDVQAAADLLCVACAVDPLVVVAALAGHARGGRLGVRP